MSLLQIPFAPEQASTFAWEVDTFYAFMVGLTVIFFVLIAVAEIFFAIKYRRRSPLEVPRPVLGGLKLELVWTIVPFVIAMGIFAWGASLYFRLYRPPAEAMEIYVMGKQWMWKFQHPSGHREINELHVPLGRRVKLTMGTEDVIHSLFVPAFRVKADVIPGRYSTIWFEATKAGRYRLFCAEYCGTSHSGMIGWVEVMEPAAYQAWLAGSQAEGSPAAAGQKLFQDMACNTCHRVDPSGRGPVLNGLFGRQVQLQNGQTVTADEEYIRESILNPRAKLTAGFEPLMPTYQGQLSEDQILQLVAYIKSLNPVDASAEPAMGAPAGGGTSPAGSPPAEQPAGSSPAPTGGQSTQPRP